MNPSVRGRGLYRWPPVRWARALTERRAEGGPNRMAPQVSAQPSHLTARAWAAPRREEGAAGRGAGGGGSAARGRRGGDGGGCGERGVGGGRGVGDGC